MWRIDDFTSDLVVLRFALLSTVTQLNVLDSCGVGDKVALAVILSLTRLQLFGINSIFLNYKERIVYSWATIVWFTSFDKKCGAITITNKRNMVLEIIGMCFLTPRSDVTHPRLLTSECNEHTFGG